MLPYKPLKLLYMLQFSSFILKNIVLSLDVKYDGIDK